MNSFSLDEFDNRLKKYLVCSDDPKRLILSDDLKNAIAFANESQTTDGSAKNLTLNSIEQICRKYNAQAVEWKISSFPFASVLMKLLYKAKKADLAVKLLQDKELSAMFDLLSSYQLCMDLLLKSKRCEEVLSLWHYFKEHSKVAQSMPYPRSLLIILYATIHEMHTGDSYEFALQLYKSIRRDGFVLPRRALCFLVNTCIKNNHPELAYELLSTVNCDEFVLGRSLKTALMARLDRFPEIFYIFERIILSDMATDCYEDNELSIEAVNLVESLLQNCDQQAKNRFTEQLKLLRRGGHLANITIDQLLNAPIALAPSFSSSIDSITEMPLDETKIKMLPSSDLSPRKLNLLAYSNETRDLDDVKSFTLAEKKQRKKEILFKKLASDIAQDGPLNA